HTHTDTHIHTHTHTHSTHTQYTCHYQLLFYGSVSCSQWQSGSQGCGGHQLISPSLNICLFLSSMFTPITLSLSLSLSLSFSLLSLPLFLLLFLSLPLSRS